ncbi:MAG: Gfo/Idh/MocA family oxidoreductase [Planctomycetota bacterium]
MREIYLAVSHGKGREMIKVGIAGIGFMGWIHWLAYQQIPGVQVVAICEHDPVKRSGDWTSIQGNFGPRGEVVDLNDVESFDDLESLCASEVDLVDICLPPSVHSSTIALAARHGKHVFCEKPLALNVDDCHAAVDACRASEKLLFVGHVLPFFPEFLAARKIISQGEYGGLVSASFKRIVSEPTWLPDFFDPNKIGGPLYDLHVHDTHFIRLLAGMPKSVYARGQMRNGLVSFCDSIFEFDQSGIHATATSGIIDQQGRPFTHGFEIRLTQATLQFEYASLNSGDELMPLKILTNDGRCVPVPLKGGDPVDAFVAEIREVISCIQSDQPSAILSGDLAMDAIRICDSISSSVRTGQRIMIEEV